MTAAVAVAISLAVLLCHGRLHDAPVRSVLPDGRGAAPPDGPSSIGSGPGDLAAGSASGDSSGWFRRLRRPSARSAADDDALALLSVFAPALGAGLTPAAALESAAATLPALSRVRSIADRGVEASRAGSPVGSLLLAESTAARLPELAVLARAWALSEVTGAPLADAAATAAETLRSRRTQARLVETTSAQARATMTLLTALPLAGPVLSLAVGVGPSQVYGSSPLTWWSLGLGGCLVAIGRIWVRALVQRVLRGPVIA